MEVISTLVPYFIFIVLLRFIWSGTLSTLVGVLKFLLVDICAILLVAFLLVLYTAKRHKVSPVLLVKKGLQTLIIAVTTASSAASFGTNVNTCEKKYGLNSSIISFGIPLGMVMFKPASAVNDLALALFFAEAYQVPCSVSWMIIAFIVVIVLAIATPPIPGGALTAYTVIFLQLGIPTEALAIALAVDAIVDFFVTGFNQFLLPFPLIGQASRTGLIDQQKLQSK